MDPDWSNLPADVIQLISEKIILKEQYDNFRLVCKEWSRICPPQPCHLIGQVPWLWLRHNFSASTFSFYDFSQSKIHNFDFPNVVNADITRCSSRGWVLLEDNHEFSLINPITRELKEYCLPSLDSDPVILEFAMNERTEDPSDFNKFLRCTNHHITNMILSSSPSEEGCIVMATFTLVWDLGFCRVGDDSWTILKLKETGCDYVSTLEYKDGLIYAMNIIGQVTLYDLRDLSQKVLIRSKKIRTDNLCYSHGAKIYLVLGKGKFDGVPLAVRRTCRYYHGISREETFEVYRCVKTWGTYNWMKVKNIGNIVLILGSIGSQTISLDLDGIELNGWEANHICNYGLKYNHDHRGAVYSHNIIVEMIGIENGSVKEIPTSFGLFSPHNTFSNWFTPALC